MSLEVRRRICIAGVVIGVYLGFRYLVPVTLPFFVGWLLAIWVSPASEWIERKIHLKKSWAGSVLLVGILAVCILFLWRGGILLWEQVKLALQNFHRFPEWGMRLLNQCCETAEQITGIRQEVSREFLLSQVGRMGENLTQMITPESCLKLVSEAGKVFMIGTGFLIAWLSAILFLQEMEVIQRKVKESSILQGVRRIARRLKETTVTYLKAQLVIMGVIAVMCTIGFWLMGSPYYLLLGTGLGLLDALPVIGTGTFLYPAAFYFLLKREFSMAVGCVILDLVTSVAREFLEPKLIGGRLGISPVIVLAAVYFGFYLYGIWGFFAGPLSLSVAYEIGKEWDLWD